MEQAKGQFDKWWRLGDAAVLLAYSTIVLWTIQYHEKWADEAQAWLIARDLDLRTIWFHELRYEGSPGLWHTILWVAQHVFHAKYAALSYIGAAFAIAGAAVLIFWAPFPRFVRWPLAFTYVMIYQYAVIARPYTLLPLLAFCAALLFKDRQHPERLTVVLVLLALLTLHGTILAGCLGLAYLAEAYRHRDELQPDARRRYVYSTIAMAVAFIFIAAIVKPTPDVEEIVQKKELARASQSVTSMLPTFWQKLTAVTTGAFIDFLIPSLLLLLLFTAWSIWRKKSLPFVLPVGTLILFYCFVHGAAHHHGTVFVAAITGVWIGWPSSEEQAFLGKNGRLAVLSGSALLLLLCFFNILDAGVVIKHEYLYPYSGAPDAVKYLKSVGAERSPMFGFLFGTVAVQAYFDQNIFANNPHAYFHHGLPLTTTVLNTDELNQIKPEYVVAYTQEPELMLKYGAPALTARGYDLVHFSDGYYLYKRGVFEREVYLIYRRTERADELAPPEYGSPAEWTTGKP
ncbi:MAG TPA: hypothetical protein VMH20_00225 [Verrucomicrobiae bacterium]|nr:hypothetical protein [Verrucomicrobiae bacterium]